MTRLATKFKNSNSLRLNSPLTNDQIFSVAPSIFAENKHVSRSEKYSHIPTIEVLEGLRKEGFLPFMVAQSNTRIESKQDFTKHMLRLRKIDEIESAEAKEIILINSHDGTSSYQMMGGIYRFVCQNGMVSGDTLSDVRLRHSGNIKDDVIEAAYTIVEEFDNLENNLECMKSTLLLPVEAEAFAQAALTLKYDDKAPVAARSLLDVRRSEDRGNDVWAVFSRIQEHLMKGGQPGRAETGRRITTRPVRAIDNDIKLNKALWIVAQALTKEKASMAV